MTRLYIIGPVTGISEDNRPAFEAARERLEQAGYIVDIPHDGIPQGTSHEDAMLMSISALTGMGYDRDGEMWRMYDGVAVLPGWMESKGARCEFLVAKRCGIPVRPVDMWIKEAR